MLIKIRRVIIVELVSPEGPNPEYPQTPTSPLNNPTFLENSTLKRVCCCCCRLGELRQWPLPPLSPLQTSPQLVRPAGQQNRCPPPPPQDRPIAPRGPGLWATLNRCFVSCRIGDLFVRSCARSLLV